MFLVQYVELIVFIFLVREDPMTTAINLNNAFYFGIFENYSMNGSFRLKNEEKWMPERSQRKEEQSAHHEHTGLEEPLIECDQVSIIDWQHNPLGQAWSVTSSDHL